MPALCRCAVEEADAGRFEAAAATAAAAVAMEPGLASAHRLHAALLGELARWDDALERAHTACELDPCDASHELMERLLLARREHGTEASS